MPTFSEAVGACTRAAREARRTEEELAEAVRRFAEIEDDLRADVESARRAVGEIEERWDSATRRSRGDDPRVYALAREIVRELREARERLRLARERLDSARESVNQAERKHQEAERRWDEALDQLWTVVTMTYPLP